MHTKHFQRCEIQIPLLVNGRVYVNYVLKWCHGFDVFILDEIVLMAYVFWRIVAYLFRCLNMNFFLIILEKKWNSGFWSGAIQRTWWYA